MYINNTEMSSSIITGSLNAYQYSQKSERQTLYELRISELCAQDGWHLQLLDDKKYKFLTDMYYLLHEHVKLF